MKTLTKITTTLVLLCSTPALANHWFLPEGLHSVRIQNPSPTASLVLWLSGPARAGEETYEEVLEIPASTMITYNLKNFPAKGFHLLKTYEQIFARVQISHDGKSWATATKGRTNDLELSGNKKEGPAELVISNNSAHSEEGYIVISSPQNQVIPYTLSPFEQKHFHFTWGTAGTIRILADYAVSAYLIKDNQTLSFNPRASSHSLETTDQAAYFQLTSSSDWDSFIVKLEDPALIAQAREQIANPNKGLPSILVADIQSGHNNENRDLLSPLKTTWSWSVKQVHGFASMASTDCNGSPSILEDFLEPKLAAGKNICFFRYKITKEVSAEIVADP